MLLIDLIIPGPRSLFYDKPIDSNLCYFQTIKNYVVFKTAGQNLVFSDLADQTDVTATGATVEKLSATGPTIIS